MAFAIHTDLEKPHIVHEKYVLGSVSHMNNRIVRKQEMAW